MSLPTRQRDHYAHWSERMNLRTKIEAAFADLEHDIANLFGGRVDDPMDDAAMALSSVSRGYEWFKLAIAPQPETEAIEITCDGVNAVADDSEPTPAP